MHHVAFALSQAMFAQAVERLDERGIRHSGVKDRGFMDSIYFQDPLGLLIELASYRFEPPHGDHARRRALQRAPDPGRARGPGDRPHPRRGCDRDVVGQAPDAVSMTNPLAHRRARMGGRDPHEEHRVATPLELLFDLVFVVAYGLAADELAHYLAEGHIQTALLGFAIAAFSITWAWINFSWFASAFDVDDWLYRLTTMVQMIGVVILALGLPALFDSIDEGEYVDNVVIVAGYVVMRVGLLFQWLRAARSSPECRTACLTYVRWISVAQVGWIALAIAHTSILAHGRRHRAA